MGYAKEKVAYLRGVADGMELSDDKYGKLLKLIISTMDEMADTIDDNEESIIDMDERMDDMDDEIEDINDCIDAIISDDDDECDCECDDDDDFVEIECPYCGETVYFDQSMLESDDELICPNCNKPIVPKIDDEDDKDNKDK